MINEVNVENVWHIYTNFLKIYSENIWLSLR
jgi:hypothetical protein